MLPKFKTLKECVDAALKAVQYFFIFQLSTSQLRIFYLLKKYWVNTQYEFQLLSLYIRFILIKTTIISSYYTVETNKISNKMLDLDNIFIKKH